MKTVAFLNPNVGTSASLNPWMPLGFKLSNIQESIKVEKTSRIFIAGHNGLVGSALLRKFKSKGYSNLIIRNRDELDLTRQIDVETFFNSEKPEYVVMAAAKVGGVWANSTLPAEFIYVNLAIQTNVIHAAWANGVRRLIFLGSSCIYPRECPQPMKEEHLLSSPLEPTNEPYAVAKIAGIKMCQSYNRQYGTRYLALMPTNLFGPNDNFNLETSHVLPALIRKIHEAVKKEQSGKNNEDSIPYVEIWGTGMPRREFLHADDMADACMHIMNLKDDTFSSLISGYDTPLINVGFGKDISIAELSNMIKEIVGFQGKLVFNPEKPDGAPRKLLDVSRLNDLGWRPKIALKEGIQMTYKWCLENSIF